MEEHTLEELLINRAKELLDKPMDSMIYNELIAIINLLSAKLG